MSLRRIALSAARSPQLSGQAFAGQSEDDRARNAVRVLAEIQKIPSSRSGQAARRGRAVIVIPDTIKAGLVIGGRRGQGLMSVKTANGTWSSPVFVSLTGGSIGFQAGVQSSDVVLVFRNDRSLDNIVNGKFTLGADAAVAAGPVGRNAAAATDGQLKAEIWSWSRARGLFAGVALDGAVLQIDDAANAAVYGQHHAARDLRVALAARAVLGRGGPRRAGSHSARLSRGPAPAIAPVTVTPSAPATSAQTSPMSGAQAAPSRGFQPVSGDDVKTEQLK
jgi:lipid-binding SYLF domain-containing protein